MYFGRCFHEMAFVIDAHSSVIDMVRLRINVMSENINVISRVPNQGQDAKIDNYIRMADRT